MREGKELYGKRTYKKREIASLTKIMNLITTLELMEKWGIDAKKVSVRATKTASSVIGTTAEIKAGG